MADVVHDEVSVSASVLDPNGVAVLLSQAEQAALKVARSDRLAHA
jgi:hypothetical protein